MVVHFATELAYCNVGRGPGDIQRCGEVQATYRMFHGYYMSIEFLLRSWLASMPRYLLPIRRKWGWIPAKQFTEIKEKKITRRTLWYACAFLLYSNFQSGSKPRSWVPAKCFLDHKPRNEIPFAVLTSITAKGFAIQGEW